MSFELVDLVEHEGEVRDVPQDRRQELRFRLRHRRIDRHDEQRNVALRQETEGRFGVVPQRRTDARRIDQYDPLAQHGCRQEHLHHGDIEPIVAIGLLGHEAMEVLLEVGGTRGREFLDRPPIAAKRDRDPRSGSRLHVGRNCRHRHDCGGQQRFAQKGVQHGALAALELAENGNVQTLLAEPPPQVGEPLAQARGNFAVEVLHRCHDAIEHVVEVHRMIRDSRWIKRFHCFVRCVQVRSGVLIHWRAASIVP